MCQSILSSIQGKMRQSIEAHMKWLEERIQELDAEIEQLTQSQAEWQADIALLKTVPGVGQVIATTLVAELPELGHVSDKCLSALVGVAPFNHDSGKQRGKRTIWGGRARVRAVLSMGVLVAVRHDPVIKAVYTHTRHRFQNLGAFALCAESLGLTFKIIAVPHFIPMS